MQQEYGVKLIYQQAYRAKEVGLEIVRGNLTESYNLLPKYSHVLTKTNEGQSLTSSEMEMVIFCTTL